MTSRQFYYIFSIFIISLKIQKMPCILYNYLQKDSYILFIIYLLIDLIGIIIAFYLSKQIKKYKINEPKKNNIIDYIYKICLIFVAFYFLIQSIVFYEAIQDLFSHILFENLSWKLFSLLLLVCVYYLSCFDYDNIGRVCELFFPIIIISLLILLIMGSIHTDFSAILPFQTIKNADFINTSKIFNIWFGDFFLIIFLGANSKNIKLKQTILTYVSSMLFVIIYIISFEGRYLNLTSLQPNVISIISEQTLLGIDIGRVDWFLILITEIGPVICCGLCLCISKNALSTVFKKVKKNYLLIFLTLAVYIMDIEYLTDINTKKEFFFNFSSNFAIFIKAIIIILIIIKIIYAKNKFKNQSNLLLKNNIKQTFTLKQKNIVKNESKLINNKVKL